VPDAQSTGSHFEGTAGGDSVGLNLDMVMCANHRPCTTSCSCGRHA